MARMPPPFVAGSKNIPVGCVPSTLVAITRCQYWWVGYTGEGNEYVQRVGTHLPVDIRLGVSTHSPLDMGPGIPTPHEQTHTCENITFLQLLAVIICTRRMHSNRMCTTCSLTVSHVSGGWGVCQMPHLDADPIPPPWMQSPFPLDADLLPQMQTPSPWMQSPPPGCKPPCMQSPLPNVCWYVGKPTPSQCVLGSQPPS